MLIRYLPCLILLFSAFPLLSQPADTIVINGRILTVDADFSVVEALAIRDGRIIANGDTRTIRGYADAGTELIDVTGATVIPGLIDNHFHFLRAVQRWHLQARLDGVNSRARALQILADKAASMATGEWFMVQGGWYATQFSDQPGGFTLEELDRVAPENPLFLQERYSTIYANTLAMKAVKLDPAAGADAAVALIRSSTANTFEDDYGQFGLGEHVYLPFFDFPSQDRPWPVDVVDNYMKIARVAAEGGWHIHEHTMSNFSVRDLLDRFEVLNRGVPLERLRWTLAHVYDISGQSIARAKALGLTLAVHGVAMHSGAAIPLRQIQDSGIVFGLGTDATIVSHYQPLITLGWAVIGLDLAGKRVLNETLSREEALIAHTRSNAWLFFQEDNLGSLEVGKYADLVVLDQDYMNVPAAEVMTIRPVLTMVGGRVVYRK